VLIAALVRRGGRYYHVPTVSDALDILFTAPHPDDLEIGCGGTIALMVKQGYRVGMVHMTNGEPTPLGDPETRLKEMRAAGDILGATVCEMVGLTNRVLMDGPEARYALASVVRKYRPRILVGIAGRTVAASPDHYQAQLITEATRFYSQLTKWDDRFAGTPPHRVDHLVIARSLRRDSPLPCAIRRGCDEHHRPEGCRRRVLQIPVPAQTLRGPEALHPLDRRLRRCGRGLRLR
jgi:LmbE family N-acetylglucosaminyl deacetylase